MITVDSAHHLFSGSLRLYYTMTPRGDPNKTAPAAVLHGSMFSKSCALAHKRVPCTRAAAQAAALRLLYHDAAKRPQQNRTCCGFAWFNVLKTLCVSTGACAMRTRSRASGGFEVIIPYFHSPAQQRKSAAPGAPHAPNTGHARRAKKGSTCKMRRKSCQPFTAPAVIPLMI